MDEARRPHAKDGNYTPYAAFQPRQRFDPLPFPAPPPLLPAPFPPVATPAKTSTHLLRVDRVKADGHARDEPPLHAQRRQLHLPAHTHDESRDDHREARGGAGADIRPQDGNAKYRIKHDR